MIAMSRLRCLGLFVCALLFIGQVHAESQWVADVRVFHLTQEGVDSLAPLLIREDESRVYGCSPDDPLSVALTFVTPMTVEKDGKATEIPAGTKMSLLYDSFSAAAPRLESAFPSGGKDAPAPPGVVLLTDTAVALPQRGEKETTFAIVDKQPVQYFERIRGNRYRLVTLDPPPGIHLFLRFSKLPSESAELRVRITGTLLSPPDALGEASPDLSSVEPVTHPPAHARFTMESAILTVQRAPEDMPWLCTRVPLWDIARLPLEASESLLVCVRLRYAQEAGR